ncbi:MAG: RHS repeat-associated core domain-containing protein [Phycisphaerales bacterium]
MAPACEQCTGSITDSVQGMSVAAATGGVAVDLHFLGDLADGANASLALSMGYGWSHTYEMSLMESGQDMLLLRGNGAISHYDRMPNGAYRAMADEFGDLTVAAPGEFHYSTADGKLYIFDLPLLGSWPGVRHLLSQIVDRNGVVTSLHYNANGQLIRVEDQFGNSLEFEYNDSGQLSRVSDPLGRTLTLVYDSTGAQLRRLILPDGSLVDYQYNLSRQIIRKSVSEPCPMPVPRTIGSAADLNNDGLINELDVLLLMDAMKAGLVGADLNRDGQITPSDISVILAQWGQTGIRPGQPTCPSLEQYTITYDSADGRPSQIKDSSGAVLFSANSSNGWKVDHDQSLSTGQMTYEPGTADFADGVGNVWRYEYDSHGLLTRVEAPLVDGASAITQYEYDPGTLRVSKIIDPLSRVTQFEYDSYGNRTQVTDALGNVTQYEYDHPTIPDLKTKMIEPDGDIWEWEYDADGNLLKEIDPLHGPGGPFNAWTYDSFGRVTTATDRNANVTSYTYDALGRMHTQTVDPGGLDIVTTYEYDAAGRLTAEIDPRGIRTEYQYDDRDRLTRRTRDPGGLGLTTTYEYDARGHVTSETNPRGVETIYEYDTRGRLTRTELDPTGLDLATEYQYDGNNRVTTSTDANGNVTRYEYDARTRRSAEILDAGPAPDDQNITTRYKYDADDNIIRMTREIDPSDGADRVIEYEYDDLNRKTAQVVDPAGLALRTEYDYAPAGGGGCGCQGTPTESNIHKVTDPAGTVTYFEYDALDRMVKSVEKMNDTADNGGDADDLITVQMYDPAGNPTRTIVRNSPSADLITEFVYDAANRAIMTIQDPGGISLTTSNSYDPNSNVAQTVLPSGNIATHIYDAANRRISTSDSIGARQTFEYDENGNILRRHDGNGNVSPLPFIYDAADRLIEEYDNAGSATTYLYDNLRNVQRVIDRAGVITEYEYDGAYRLTGIVRDVGSLEVRTELAYDDAGNSRFIRAHNTNTSGAEVQVTEYTYDAANRRLSAISPDDADGNPHTTLYAYDAVGNVTLRTDPNQDVTAYTYDDAYRLTRRDYTPSGSTLTFPPTQGPDLFTFDRASRMLTATRGYGGLYAPVGVTYTYDALSRPLSTSRDGHSISMGYVVSPGVDTRTLLYPSGRGVLEHRDGRGRLTQLDDTGGGGTLVTTTYDLADRPTARAYANATSAAWTYDTNNRLTRLTHAGPGGALIDLEYGYDTMDNPLYARHHHAPNTSELYRYDALHRLVRFERGSLLPDNSGIAAPTPVPDLLQSHLWGLDQVGNWLTSDTQVNGIASPESRSANKANEYLSVGATPVLHDDNGNTIDDGVLHYEYDIENRVTRITRVSDSAVLAVYVYDAMGRRARKIVTSSGALDGQTIYVADPEDRILSEYDELGALHQEHVYGAYLDHLLLTDTNMDADGSAIGAGDRRLFAHEDALFSVHGLSDELGELAEGYLYDPYSRQYVFEPGANLVVDFGGDDVMTLDGAGGVGNSHRYTGRQLDPETGRSFYRARHLDPTLGRFTQRDPLGVLQSGVNLMQYVQGRPTLMLDPSGLSHINVNATYRYDPSRKAIARFWLKMDFVCTCDSEGCWRASIKGAPDHGASELESGVDAVEDNGPKDLRYTNTCHDDSLLVEWAGRAYEESGAWSAGAAVGGIVGGIGGGILGFTVGIPSGPGAVATGWVGAGAGIGIGAAAGGGVGAVFGYAFDDAFNGVIAGQWKVTCNKDKVSVNGVLTAFIRDAWYDNATYWTRANKSDSFKVKRGIDKK